MQRWRAGKWAALRWESSLALITGAVGGIFLWTVVTTLPPVTQWSGSGLVLYGCFAAPAVLLLFLSAAVVFIGIGCKVTTDEDREWWARMGGWVLLALLGWSLFGALILFGPLALLWSPKMMAPMGGITGLFTLIAGYGSGTSASKDGQAKDSLLAVVKEQAVRLAAPLSLAAVVIALSLASSWLLVLATRSLEALADPASRGRFTLSHDFLAVVRETPWWLVALFIVYTACIGWGLSLLINMNKFSLHAIYRNRLVRAYLGASNTKRNPNPFTGFDPADNLPLQELRDPQNPSLPQRPLHIVNMALNLVTGDNLAWQQRKAETFTASALHCGNYRLGYRFTKHYAVNQQGNGLSLGTAVAISGAAASPNQGYHSSPLVALLMTLFNVRLGWWLGNPGAMGHDTFRDPAPHSPVRHLVKEGLGLTDSSSPYVYLSDGGHFENLGLYEMVLRRCRLIVVSDAGCDPECALEDLGGAIRKIRVDLGVKIEMKKFEIFSRTDKEKSGHYCALGEIDYGTADEGGRKGILLYIKPALLGNEPRDIYNYSRQSETFPHESTSDQWFSESQFESYRALGQRVIEWMFAWKASNLPEADTRADVLTDLVHQAYVASETPRPPFADTLFVPESTADAGVKS